MARQSRKPLQSLLNHYTLKRFLFRMSRSPLKEKFVLKGGLLLMGMRLQMAWTTRNIDILRLESEDMETVGTSIREIGSMAFDDVLVYEFDPMSIDKMAEDAKHPGIRLKFNAD